MRSHQSLSKLISSKAKIDELVKLIEVNKINDKIVKLFCSIIDEEQKKHTFP